MFFDFFVKMCFQQGKKRDKPRPQSSGGFGLLPPPPGGKIAPPPSSGSSNHNMVPQTVGTATGKCFKSLVFQLIAN